MTVVGGAGDESLTNYGHLVGSVEPRRRRRMRSTTSPISSAPQSHRIFRECYDSGATIYRWRGECVHQRGLAVDGCLVATCSPSNVTGNFVQTGTVRCMRRATVRRPRQLRLSGRRISNFNYSTTASDRLNVDRDGGPCAARVVRQSSCNPARALPGSPMTRRSVSAEPGGATHCRGAIMPRPSQTAVATYALIQPNGPNDIDLHYSVDFCARRGSPRISMSVGAAVNAIQTARSSPAFAARSPRPCSTSRMSRQLGTVYNSLSGEGVACIRTGRLRHRPTGSSLR